MNRAVVAAFTLAAFSTWTGRATSTYQAEVSFTGTKCKDESATLVWYATKCDTTPVSCTPLPGVPGFTQQIQCIDAFASHAQATFPGPYVLMQIYKGENGAGCSGDIDYGFAVVPDGTCYPSRLGVGSDKYAFKASIGSDNSVTVWKFRDYSTCSLLNFKAQNQATEVDGKSCLYVDYFGVMRPYKLTLVVPTTPSPPVPTTASTPPTTEPPIDDSTTEPTATPSPSADSTSSSGSNESPSTTRPTTAPSPAAPNITDSSSESEFPVISKSPSPGTPSSTTNASSESTSDTNPVLLVGIGGGSGIVIVVIIVGLCLCCRRKNSNKPAESYTTIEGAGMANNGSYAPCTTPVTVGTSTDRRNTSTSTGTATATGQGKGLWIDRDIRNLRINYADIIKGQELSRGGFGVVYRGTYRGQTVALKQLLPARAQNNREIEAFLSEAKLLSKMKHDCIVQMIGLAWNSPNDLVIVTEFMEGGDLRDLLSVYREANIPTGFTRSKLEIARDIAEALVYLHDFDPIVVHRDLKSMNVLLSTKLRAKLTDFGVSRERAEQMTTGVGSWLWMAPEVLGSRKYDEKADVFAFGVVLSELDTHHLPYQETRGMAQVAILNGIVDGSVKVVFSENADSEVVKLARECMARKPNKRPTAKAVLRRLRAIAAKY